MGWRLPKREVRRGGQTCAETKGRGGLRQVCLVAESLRCPYVSIYCCTAICSCRIVPECYAKSTLKEFSRSPVSNCRFADPLALGIDDSKDQNELHSTLIIQSHVSWDRGIVLKVSLTFPSQHPCCLENTLESAALCSQHANTAGRYSPWVALLHVLDALQM